MLEDSKFPSGIIMAFVLLVLTGCGGYVKLRYFAGQPGNGWVRSYDRSVEFKQCPLWTLSVRATDLESKDKAYTIFGLPVLPGGRVTKSPNPDEDYVLSLLFHPSDRECHDDDVVLVHAETKVLPYKIKEMGNRAEKSKLC
jgi:hypothetical protein